MTRTSSTPLDHRLRRRILRRLHEVDLPYSAGKLSTDLKRQLHEILYHARVLVEYEAVEETRRGPDNAGTCFESKIADDAEIIELLISTRAEDEAQQP